MERFVFLRTTGLKYSTLLSFVGYSLILGFIYRSVLLGSNILKTIGYWPKGPLFVSDPVAGGTITYPMEQWIVRAWSHAQLPLWFPTQGYGLTLGGNQGAAWFLPEVLFHVLFPHHFSVWNVVRLLITGMGTYFLALELGVGRVGAFLSGATMMFSGPIPPNINLEMVNPIMILPFLALSSLRVLRANSWRERLLWSTILAIAVDASFLAGFDEELPLELIFVAALVVAWLVAKRVPWRTVLARLGMLATSVVIGLMGSAIATINLMLPLRSYFSYQASSSYLSHSLQIWLATLISPYFFGSSLTAGPYDLGQSIWALGNPMVWVLAGLGAVSLVTFRSQSPSRWWGITCIGMVIFGILGFSDTFGVLRLFSVPPYNLVIMVRFLPFLWWPALALLAGYGFDAVAWTPKRLVALMWAILLLCLAVPTAILAWNSLTPSGLLAQATRTDVIIIGVAAFSAATLLIFRKHAVPQYILGALLLVSLIYYVPKNFFSAKLPDEALLSASSRQLSSKGKLNYFAGFYNSSSLVSGTKTRSIEAFGPFYPKAYARTLQALFPTPPANGPGGVTFFAAPTMYYQGQPITRRKVQILKFLGVNNLIVRQPLPNRLSPNLNSHWYAPLPSSQIRRALATLIEIYLQRSDLQAAFPQESTGFDLHLMTWVMDYGLQSDSAKAQLITYRSTYRSIYADLVKNPSLSVFQSRPLVPYRPRVVNNNGGPVYIYKVQPTSSEVWTPSKFLETTSDQFQTLLRRRTFPSLLNTAYFSSGASFPKSALGEPSPTVHVINFQEGTERQILRLEANHAGWIVLRNEYTKHMQVTVNAKKVHFFPVDNNLWTAVHVSSGYSTVTLNYFTPAEKLAWWMSVIVSSGLVLAVAAIWLEPRIRHTSERREESVRTTV